jgi:Holliday junction resolvase-like predicted endonuclease
MNRTTILEKSLEIIVPHEWSNDQKGSYLEGIAAQILRRQSYEVTERIRFTGMEIDLLANHKPSGDVVYVECKFLSSTVSANVIDLMLGQAFRRKLTRVALFSAGLLSKEAKGASEELKFDSRISFSFYGPEALLEALVDSGIATQLPESELLPSVSHATLLVYPDQPYIWLLQDQKDGRPYRVLPYCSAPSSHRPNAETIRLLLDKHELLEGLPVTDYLDLECINLQLTTTSKVLTTSEPVEVVGQVATADTILDYRPCRPEDFVGRVGIQKEIWDFLSEVRDKTTSTRLVALVGASGYGKSSLVSKLAERFKNIKWKNKYFLFPVDVRSARGPLFVSEALLQAIKSAADGGFIPIPDELSVTDASNILASDTISRVLATLERENKVLVVFFDQFEEVFTKDDLLPVFRSFRRFALDIHAKQSNIVVGFSWRTGISFSDDNPAYQLWNELRDHRITKTLGPFDNAEASGLVTQFEEELGTKLLPPLRRRLLEQGQGLPWFLKKLCIHVHGQITRGISQVDLLGSRLNVQALFDEDLDPLTEAQLSCLRFIASNSPVDSLEVYDRYSSEIVGSLSDKRLVIRAGQRFAVYWDIFRDYITEGKVPAIPWTYIPNCTLRMALSAYDILKSQGAMSVSDLAKELTYSEATTVNIITDLQNLALCGKRPDGMHFLLDELDQKLIPDRIRSQFVEHVLYQRLLQEASDSNPLSRSKAIDLIRSLYSGADVKPKTRDNYFVKLVPWLEFAGLIETDGNHIQVFSPSKRGSKYGASLHHLDVTRDSIFLASAPPEFSKKLFIRLVSEGNLSRDLISSEHLRNPAQDLSALGLARWSPKGLVAITKTETIQNPEKEFNSAAIESMVFVLFNKLVTENPSASRPEIGLMLASKLGRNWKATSAQRYANGLYRYREYFMSQVTQQIPLLEFPSGVGPS